MWYFSLFMFLIFVLTGVISGVTPMFSRQSTPFGIAVRGRHDFIEEKKRSFAWWNIGASILLALPMFIFPFMGNTERAEILSSIYLLAAFLVFFLISVGLYFKYELRTE